MPWVEREEPWYRIEVRYCDVTGQLLPRTYWSFEHAGRELCARDPECEELFRRYVLSDQARRAPSTSSAVPVK